MQLHDLDQLVHFQPGLVQISMDISAGTVVTAFAYHFDVSRFNAISLQTFVKSFSMLEFTIADIVTGCMP